jgi:alpha-tubulin suppressor-like RCC1 family protein
VPTFNGVMADQIDAGLAHTCALLRGKATCWGLSQNGQVGAGIYGDTSAGGPAPVSGNISFTKISAGGNATCGINGSNLYCWGDIRARPTGQTGSPTPQLFYTYPANSSGPPIFDVAVGGGFACVSLGFADRANCFGRNSSGQLTGIPGPDAAVPGIQYLAISFVPSYVFAGNEIACLHAAMDWELECWGNNHNGELGNPSGQPSAGPVEIASPSGGQPAKRLQNPQVISIGPQHSCAIDSSGQAWCWGYARHGELGNANGPGSSGLATPVVGGHKFRLIAAGGEHTCAVDVTNTIFCWGDNSVGQLGTQVQGGYNPAPYPTNPPRG